MSMTRLLSVLCIVVGSLWVGYSLRYPYNLFGLLYGLFLLELARESWHDPNPF